MTAMHKRARAERLDLLGRVLRDRPGITAAELARELGVTERSVFRDIEHLRDRGYPIDASRGRGGGLRLHGSWGLGRVLLSSEEALCALLSLAVSEKLDFPMFSTHVTSARRKIVDAFPASERRRIAPLRERVFVGAAASAQVRASYREPARAPVQRLQAAFVATHVITADYMREDGTRFRRRLEPHAVVINWPAWYLLAHDLTKDSARTFRFDRILGVEVHDETFTPRPRQVARELLEDPRVRIDSL